MMWVLFVLSLIELVVVHLFVALKWPLIGWTLTTISAIGAVWLVRWILSFKRLPHELRNGVLSLRLGNLKNVEVALENVSGVKSSWEQGAHDDRASLNLAPIAHPNRCLDLKNPVDRGKTRVFIRCDDAASFDLAMRNHGFAVE